jgi:hypothetical protein
MDVEADVLCFITNFAIQEGNYIKDWKNARVIPLFKSGNNFNEKTFICHQQSHEKHVFIILMTIFKMQTNFYQNTNQNFDENTPVRLLDITS